jgi:hypothetical protein
MGIYRSQRSAEANCLYERGNGGSPPAFPANYGSARTFHANSSLFCGTVHNGIGSCRGERPRSTRRSPRPVPGAGEEKTRAGLVAYPQKPLCRRVGADHPPFWLPIPNLAAETFSGSCNAAPQDAISPYKSAPYSEACARSEPPSWKPVRSNGKKK